MIHCFSYKGLNIVLDVASNSVHVVDDICYALLTGASTMAWPESELATAREELDNLERTGKLNAKDIMSVPLYYGDNVVKALCLHVAHDCNMRCSYCFAATGSFGQKRELMSEEVARAAVDFMAQASGSRKHCEIDFFGGEPLMNMAVVKSCVEYIRAVEKNTGKIFKITLTTNALALNEEITGYLNQENISLVLSLDGRASTHNALRPDCAGKDTHERVVNNIKRAVESRHGKNYYVRGTFTALNTDFADDAACIIEKGFDEFSLEPVVTDIAGLKLHEGHLGEIGRQYELLAEKLLEYRRDGRRVNFFHYNIDLTGGPCIAKRTRGCGAGNDYMAVAPDGRLYPCHQFVGRDEFVAGDVFSGIQNKEVGEKLRSANLFAKEECLRCWAKYFCSGGCHASNLAANNDLLKPYALGCAMQKKRLEMALWLYVAERLPDYNPGV